MNIGRYQVDRYRAPDVTGLEVWNLPLQRGLFWELCGTDYVQRRRDEGAHDLTIAGELVGHVVEAVDLLSRRYSFASVFVTGGLTELTGFRGQLERRLPLTVVQPGSGVFGFEAGGRALLQSQLDGSDGVILDVGQTAVKVISGARRAVKPRPASLPRHYLGTPRPPGERHVDGAIELIASAFTAVSPDAEARRRIILALPCPVSDELEPGGCTYGWESAPDLVARLFAAFEARAPHAASVPPVDALTSTQEAPSEGARQVQARFGHASPGEAAAVRASRHDPDDAGVGGPWRALVLNDAELAAESARALGSPRPTLVLTLGFGPGGALLAAE